MLGLTYWLFVPALIAAGLVCYGYRRGRNPFWVLLPLLFVYLGALLAWQDENNWQEREENVQKIADRFITVQGRICSMEEKDGTLQLVLKDNKISNCSIPGMLVTIEPASKYDSLRLGQVILIKGKVSPFSGPRNPGEFDFKTYYHSLGLDCRLTGKKLQVVNSRDLPLLEGLRQVRQWGKSLLDCYTEKEDAGIFAAAVLGDKSGLLKEIKSLYQKNGIAHLLAISGVKTLCLVSPKGATSGLKLGFLRLYIAKKYIKNLCFKGQFHARCPSRFCGS